MRDLQVKRPGTGEILAEHYSTVLGMAASEDIPADELLQVSQVRFVTLLQKLKFCAG